MTAVNHWRDEENARRYDEFSRTYPMYRLTSADLVRVARLGPDSRVLDLACGTGVTTEAILAALGPAGRVTGFDASPAMLDRARAHVPDPRVGWVEAVAEDLAIRVTEDLTHVICNSAIWQLELEPVVAAASRMLVPGGRFVCNLGVAGRPDPARKPSLHELMRAYAVIDHDFVPRPSAMSRRLVTEADLRRVLTDHGLVVEPTEYVEYDFDAQQLYAWMSVPLFTEQFTGLTYEQRMAALDKAYVKLDASRQPPSRWAILAARRPTA